LLLEWVDDAPRARLPGTGGTTPSRHSSIKCST
jgi:hypothetical protein